MESTKNSKVARCSANITNTCCVIYVGSRKSQLALIQTHLVIEKLKNFYLNNPDRSAILHKAGCLRKNEVDFKVVSMTTTGDKVLDKPLPEIGTKSLFTRELEIELLQGRVDFVVHSLKDLPTTLPEGCIIGAILKRESPEDTVVLKKSLRERMNPLDLFLNHDSQSDGRGFKVGTSSHRRIAMIKRCNSDLECIDIRGNLNTRISKLDNDEGEYSAIVLAKAGLDRMGWSDRSSVLLRPETNHCLEDWCYAVGQGALAVECRSDDHHIRDILSPIIDLKTAHEVVAERSLMRKLEGGCSVPLGVRSSWTQGIDGSDVLNLNAIVLSLDGKKVVKGRGDLCPLNHELKSNFADTELETTGIQFSKSAFAPRDITRSLLNCSQLGVNVANVMINLGCLELMNYGK